MKYLTLGGAFATARNTFTLPFADSLSAGGYIGFMLGYILALLPNDSPKPRNPLASAKGQRKWNESDNNDLLLLQFLCDLLDVSPNPKQIATPHFSDLSFRVTATH